MATILITDEAYEALDGMAIGGGFSPSAATRDDDMWCVPIDKLVARRLADIRQPGESDSALILRLVANQLKAEARDGQHRGRTLQRKN